MSRTPGEGPPGLKWLRLAVLGTLLMGAGSLVLVFVQWQTRGKLREVLTETKGLIRTDEQLQVLNEVMTRGLLLSLGALGMVLIGVGLSILGLFAFFGARRRAGRATRGEAVNGT